MSSVLKSFIPLLILPLGVGIGFVLTGPHSPVPFSEQDLKKRAAIQSELRAKTFAKCKIEPDAVDGETRGNAVFLRDQPGAYLSISCEQNEEVILFFTLQTDEGEYVYDWKLSRNATEEDHSKTNRMAKLIFRTDKMGLGQSEKKLRELWKTCPVTQEHFTEERWLEINLKRGKKKEPFYQDAIMTRKLEKPLVFNKVVILSDGISLKSTSSGWRDASKILEADRVGMLWGNDNYTFDLTHPEVMKAKKWMEEQRAMYSNDPWGPLDVRDITAEQITSQDSPSTLEAKHMTLRILELEELVDQ